MPVVMTSVEAGLEATPLPNMHWQQKPRHGIEIGKSVRLCIASVSCGAANANLRMFSKTESS